MATTRAILKHFEVWEKAQFEFLELVAELIVNPLNVDVLVNAGVTELLRPLLLHNTGGIQQLACANLSKLAARDGRLAKRMITEGILAQLTYSLRKAHRQSKKGTTNVLRSISKHSAHICQSIVHEGGVELLIPVLSEFDPAVKEIAAGTLGNIARHNPQLAQVTADCGAVKELVHLIQDKDPQLKRTLCATLAKIAKHTSELGSKVAESGVLPFVSAFLQVEQRDDTLKAEGCAVLHSVARHTKDLAQAVLSTNIFPNIIILLKSAERMCRRNAAMVVCEVCKHATDQAQFVLDAGTAPALVDNISDVHGFERLPGIIALGYIASWSPALSTAVIISNALPPLVDALEHEVEDHLKGASAWALGQIGKHTNIHAKEVALVGTILRLVSCVRAKGKSADLRKKCELSIKSIVNRLDHPPALDSLLHGPILPEQCLRFVLAQIAKLVPTDVDLRTKLLLSGSFSRLQELHFAATETTQGLIEQITSVYPEEIKSFYHRSKYRVFECKPDPAYTIRDPNHNFWVPPSKHPIPEQE